MDQPMRKRPIAFGLSLICTMAIYGSASGGYIINAASGSSVDIQAAVNQAVTGDTVAIPAGRFLFTGQVFAPDGIHIMGAGRDSTYLIKNDDLSAWHAMITVDAKTGQPFIFSGITLQGRLDALQGTNRTTAQTTVTDQVLVIKVTAQNGTHAGAPTGVIYQNEFIDNWYINLG